VKKNVLIYSLREEVAVSSSAFVSIDILNGGGNVKERDHLDELGVDGA
jgi:hypothetical protein